MYAKFFKMTWRGKDCLLVDWLFCHHVGTNTFSIRVLTWELQSFVVRPVVLIHPFHRYLSRTTVGTWDADVMTQTCFTPRTPGRQGYKLTEQVTGMYVVVMLSLILLLQERIIWSSMKRQASLVHLKYGSAADHWNVYILLRKRISATAPGHHMCTPWGPRTDFRAPLYQTSYWALVRVTFLILNGGCEVVVTVHHTLRIQSEEEETSKGSGIRRHTFQSQLCSP